MVASGAAPLLELPMRTGKDARGKALLGYSLEPMVAGGACGVSFDAANTVSGITPGGVAAKDNLLRVGDVVLKVAPHGPPQHGLGSGTAAHQEL